MGLGKNLKRLAWRAGNLVFPNFHVDHPPHPGPTEARAIIVSFYMKNISAALVAAQRAAVQRLVPPDTAFLQVKTRLLHGESIDRFLKITPYRTYLFLDIDCIPIRGGAIEELITRAEQGYLVGAVQRSNHKDNDGHLYAGPFCIAFTRATFEALGRPSFVKTKRGDVGQELTYRAEERGIAFDLLWPTHVEEPLWPLTDGLMFGRGTTYADRFWHAFDSRDPAQQPRFIARCQEILAEKSVN